MDITDISKMASRKRMNAEVVELRQKVSRETANIIKIKVAQDTSIWDLKEKLRQLEGNHERLQQNMVKVQMEHEAVSGQYQEELRLRPDTLNKLSGTREICDVLEEYGERLRRTLSRCRTDQQTLGDAYGACGARVRALAADASRTRAALREQRAATRLAAEQAQADARLLQQLRQQLGDAGARDALLQQKCRELTERLVRYDTELRQREETVAALQADAARAALERQAGAAELQRAAETHRRQIEAAQERTEAERAARTASELRAAGLEQELAAAQDLVLQLRAERAEAVTTIEQTKTELASLTDDKKVMQKAIEERNQRVMTLETDISCLKDRLLEMEKEKQELSEQLGSAEQLLAMERGQLQERSQQLQTLQAALAEEQEAHATQRASDVKKLEELGGAVAERERELELKSGTVARLMADLAAEAQARYRAESALRAKDDELAKQMAIILELRAEKERLQEKITGLQATMENVRKEVTGPALAQGQARPQVQARPQGQAQVQARPQGQAQVQARPQGQARPQVQAPAERDADDLLYSFLSDGSVDGDALDAREVNRRFEALKRGERSRPMSLGQIKKELSVKNRKYFKHKRLDTSCKKTLKE